MAPQYGANLLNGLLAEAAIHLKASSRASFSRCSAGFVVRWRTARWPRQLASIRERLNEPLLLQFRKETLLSEAYPVQQLDKRPRIVGEPLLPANILLARGVFLVPAPIV